jgi:hypothetical protein
MDFKLFFIGIGFWIIAYLAYLFVHNKKPSSKKTNWEGPTGAKLSWLMV